MSGRRPSRRQFIRGLAAAACGPYVLTSPALGAGDAEPASERVVLGCIGVGPRGRLNQRGLMHRGGQVVAVCDVEAAARQRAARIADDFYARRAGSASYRGCAAYADFRQLLARDDIDAVMIATPDHWHVPIAIAAAKTGKDTYVEKPLGTTIAEGRALVRAVRRYQTVFMHGTEQRSFRQFRHACELARNGYLGELHTIRVACPGGQSTGVHPPQPVPQGLDYDLWLGPAPWKPYTPARVRPGGWYFISDYAPSGFVAGWGVHHLDIAQWALDADRSGPVEVEGRGAFPAEGLFDTPLSWNIDYTYANGVRVNFTDNRQNAQGVRLEGSEGWVHVTRGSIEAQPRSLLDVTIRPGEVHLYRTRSDDANFLQCVRSRAETASPIEAAHRSTSACYLGNIALRLGRKLRWDPQTEHFVDEPQADRMLARAMRAPWRL
ncbi:MAG: Gfo/Idh/MocA family protein [Candidatus Brocadiia bacterium]